MCHPMTIGKVISNYGPKRKKGYPKSIHLVGTGNIEVRQEMFKTINIIKKYESYFSKITRLEYLLFKLFLNCQFKMKMVHILIYPLKSGISIFSPLYSLLSEDPFLCHWVSLILFHEIRRVSTTLFIKLFNCSHACQQLWLLLELFIIQMKIP